ncbi:MAG: lipid-A-disaccharide synthase [Bacteroidales bacterium]
MKYYLIAGEASGDLHASHLMSALKELDPNAEFRYFGGDEMQKVGGTLVKHYREMAFMGFVSVALNLRTILRNMKTCEKDITDFNPDVVIPVDYPGFNLKMAKFVRTQLHIPVFYFISPKIWAWKEGRIKAIRKYVDKMLSILPFEVDYFKKHNYKVDYIGNPTLDEVYHYLNGNPEKILRNKPILAILCGSRKQEIRDNLPIMLKAASQFPEVHPIIAGAPGIDPEYYKAFMTDSPVEIQFGCTYQILNSAHAAMVTSGTATLETALFNVPQVVSYYTGGGYIFYKVIRKMLKVPYVSLVNLIADKLIVDELLGYKATPESLTKELGRLIQEESYRSEMMQGYATVKSRLGEPGAPQHAAKAIVDALQKR